MTGTIMVLSTGNDLGVIAMENGLSIRFESSAVLAYDVGSLSVGQTVTFEVDGGVHPRAVNVFAEKRRGVSEAETKDRETHHLRFRGFEQTGSIRSYRFEWVSSTDGKRSYIVTGDLSLFRKHGIGIQEGPGICMRLLLGQLDPTGAPQGVELTRSALSDADMVAYLASRPSARVKPGPRRKPVAERITTQAD